MVRFIQKTQMIFGAGALSELSAELLKRGVDKLLIVVDPGIRRAGVLAQVEKSLAGSGIGVEIFDEVEANPTDGTITRAGEICARTGRNGVLGVGGGSPMDAAKAIAVMAVNDGPLSSYCGAGADPWKNPPLPIFAVPTTAGTGAELSGAAMINLVAEHRKVDIFGRSIQPDVAILDPELTLGLPPALTASTGIDALSHALEAYVAKFASPITDMFATRSIELIVGNIRRAWSVGTDVEARGNMLLGSALAIPACSAGLGVVHSVAQTIGGYYNLPHGTAIAACSPEGYAYNALAVPEKFAEVAGLLGEDVDGCEVHRAAALIKPAIERLLEDLELTGTLVDLGVKVSDIDTLAANCMLDGCTPTNPRPMSAAAFKDLLGRMLHS